MNLAKTFGPGDTEGLRAWIQERARYRASKIASGVGQTIADVATRGVEAVRENALRFDVDNAPGFELWVRAEELAGAEVPSSHTRAILESISRVREFHEAQLAALTQGWQREARGWSWSIAAGAGGGAEGQRLLPIATCGIYVPGGKASYPSSVIMNAVPAQVAGVDACIVATPASRDGLVNPAVLVAARELGIDRILKVGGAAAIAALALGLEGVKCDVVVGPGNNYVNEAKRQLWGFAGFDGYAGPSEVCVLADDEANSAWAAADLLTQVEHSEDNVGTLITLSQAKADLILSAIEDQLASAPRAAIMRTALQEHGCLFVATSLYEACEVINLLAPEHLSMMVQSPETALTRIENCGCVLLGDFTPQSAGDFVSGPSHTLPTSFAARYGSPVNVMSFLKFQSVSCLTQTDLEALTPTIEAFGEMEGFPAHARGAQIRTR